jgi:hypothetical protein
MSESTSSGVECPVCGESFDPTDAGGWCTNSECGEWQYIGDEVPEPAESTDEEVSVDLSAGAAEDEEPAGGDSAESEQPAESDESADSDETSDSGTSPAPETGADEGTAPDGPAPTPAIRRIDDAAETSAAEKNGTASEAGGDAPVDDADGETADAEAAGGAASAATDDAETGDDDGADDVDLTCPDCEARVAAEDSFCADCGADLSALAEPTLEECPSCGESVADDDSFCASCGEDLDAARASLGGDDESEETATETAAETSSDVEGEAPDSLVLHLEGEEIAVTDDETVGREVRRILTKTGAEEDSAVRIHREHVRFVREAGQFYLVDLGDNPTVLNGRYLSKGDREPVGPGDELELSDVATLSITAP